MKTITLLSGLILACFVVGDVWCMTNREFFELTKDYAEDLEKFDLGDPEAENDDGVIALPGNADDELDLAYIFSRLDFQHSNVKDAQANENDKDLGWWRRRRRRRRRPVNPCHCKKLYCSCCVSHTFSLNVVFHTYRYTLRGCLNIGYISSKREFNIGFSLNGRQMYGQTISLKNGLSICRKVPGLKIAKVCLDFYNIDLRKRRICAKLSGSINVFVRTFSVHIPIACPIPLPFSDVDFNGLHNNLQVAMNNTDTGDVTEVSLAELPTLLRQLQIELADLYANKVNKEDDQPMATDYEQNY